MIKLNGGLATTMGLQQPKSLVEARDGRSFLEIIVGQMLALRRSSGARLPLLLMNSEATAGRHARGARAPPRATGSTGCRSSSARAWSRSSTRRRSRPSAGPTPPRSSGAPPGHGDVYGALRRSGLLAALLERGFRYAMISNSDNLGATLDPRIAAFASDQEIPFLMEVVEGTAAERKGGHIARRRTDGQLVLREIAQVPPEDEDSFTDFRHWRYYNTNSLWVDLRGARATPQASGTACCELPLIVNRKTVDPRDPQSPAVLQLESAMGAAIGVFGGARLVRVPRSRFVPVKTTDDLLVLRSDVYRVSDGLIVEPIPERRDGLPFVELDKRFYRLLDQFEARFPEGSPSLREAERLVVRGDVTFAGGVVVRGAVELSVDGATTVAAGTLLQ